MKAQWSSKGEKYAMMAWLMVLLVIPVELGIIDAALTYTAPAIVEFTGRTCGGSHQEKLDERSSYDFGGHACTPQETAEREEGYRRWEAELVAIDAQRAILKQREEEAFKQWVVK